VGWAAVSGNLTPLAWYLFAIIFMWTPVHFWALALMIKEDYRNAGVPMLPVVRGDHKTAVQIAFYTVLTVAVTLMPVIGGHVGLAALFLFAIVFIWTPPHFWALALLIKDNYANARVPMLPVVRGDRATARQIVLYSLVLVAATLLPWGWGGAGPLYVVCALALGAVFVWLAERLRRDTTPRRAMLLFHYSLLYLALLFAALAVDTVV
jgi:heme O synthase-like polyprenyltransferase